MGRKENHKETNCKTIGIYSEKIAAPDFLGAAIPQPQILSSICWI